MTAKKVSKKKMDAAVTAARMKSFERLNQEIALGSYLWSQRDSIDADFSSVGNTGVGEALHNVVCFAVLIYRDKELRKKLEALVAKV